MKLVLSRLLYLIVVALAFAVTFSVTWVLLLHPGLSSSLVTDVHNSFKAETAYLPEGRTLDPEPFLYEDPILGPVQFERFMEKCASHVLSPRPLDLNASYFEGYRMPDFIIAGVQKAGTSSMVEYLLTHPKIHIRHSEIRFFDKNFLRGPSWYAGRILGSPNATSDFILGEKSNDYIFSRTFPERVKRFIPNVKIIVLLREPIARAFSEYRMRSADFLDNRSFSLAINDELSELESKSEREWGLGQRQRNGRYIGHGMYYRQLQHLYKYISPCQVHVVISERLLSPTTRAAELARVFWFLGASMSPNIKFFRYNAFELRAKKRMKNKTIMDWDWNSAENIGVRQRLEPIFTIENKLLYDFLGKGVKEWADPVAQ